jgi:hypothetical protein
VGEHRDLEAARDDEHENQEQCCHADEPELLRERRVDEVGLDVRKQLVARGFKIAMLANDGFSKLLAVGLTFAFALQTFIIVGGILRLIPLTGITLPFVSYGGSSVVANFVLLAGLLLVSNRANALRE